jgi:hypothetical protein
VSCQHSLDDWDCLRCGAYARLATLARALVAALPRCSCEDHRGCVLPAMHMSVSEPDTGFCDEHHGPYETTHADYAAALRELVKALEGRW